MSAVDTLSDGEKEMVKAIFLCATEAPKVNTREMARLAGYKNATSVNTAWHKLRIKLGEINPILTPPRAVGRPPTTGKRAAANRVQPPRAATMADPVVDAVSVASSTSSSSSSSLTSVGDDAQPAPAAAPTAPAPEPVPAPRAVSKKATIKPRTTTAPRKPAKQPTTAVSRKVRAITDDKPARPAYGLRRNPRRGVTSAEEIPQPKKRLEIPVMTNRIFRTPSPATPPAPLSPKTIARHARNAARIKELDEQMEARKKSLMAASAHSVFVNRLSPVSAARFQGLPLPPPRPAKRPAYPRVSNPPEHGPSTELDLHVEGHGERLDRLWVERAEKAKLKAEEKKRKGEEVKRTRVSRRIQNLERKAAVAALVEAATEEEGPIGMEGQVSEGGDRKGPAVGEAGPST
ncbi:hypothetical protein AAFC00_005821 [Neodothiora populina]|uniref:Uncharacterized protein n=1 Tax=Neodothiora populina TaxID=2781224 RepID=A0ABR3P5Z1_9PEZI